MKTIISFISLFYLLPVFAITPKTADEIILHVEANLAPKGIQSLYAFKTIRVDKTVTEYEVRFEIQDTEHIRGYFKKPQREQGREILRLKDELWTFMPSAGRTIRVGDIESFAGGDFSNADILRVDWHNQYDPSIVKDSPKQWVLDLKAKNNLAAYAKMRLWVDKETMQPVQQHFFDSQGLLLKSAMYASVKTFGKITRPSFMLMTNVITKQKSELSILEFQSGVVIPNSKFVVDNLGK